MYIFSKIIIKFSWMMVYFLRMIVNFKSRSLIFSRDRLLSFMIVFLRKIVYFIWSFIILSPNHKHYLNTFENLWNTFFRVSMVPAYCLWGLYILESGLFCPGLWPPPFEPFRFMLGRCAIGRCCNWLPGRWGWLRGYGRCFLLFE